MRTYRGDSVRSNAGREMKLGDTAVRWNSPQLGEWIEVQRCRIAVPSGAEFRWPTVPFNPYAADGAAPFGSESGVLVARIDGQPVRWEIDAQDTILVC